MQVKIKYEINFKDEDLIEQIMKHREISLDWLEASSEFFNDGSSMYGFQDGMEILLYHISNRIGILVDQDTDGFCSSVMIGQWLKDKNPNVNIQYIIPEGKIHGILPHLIPDDLDLLIIPDASSSESKEHKILQEKGIDILVLDHHEFSEIVESKETVIINPHNPKCSYPNKNLSGTGVVFKFISAIDRIFYNSDDYKKYIDLAAIATIGDVMDLRNLENKAIVNIGLKNINNPYFIAYLKADGRIKGQPINPTIISFYLVPQINALIRVGTLEEKYDLLNAMLGELPAEMVVASIIKIKGKQDRKKDPVVTRIIMNLQKMKMDCYNIIFSEIPNSAPKAMTGLIAGQLSGMYNKPVFLGKRDPVTGIITGSARGVNNSNIDNLKDICEQSGLFIWNRGHQLAHGFMIEEENIEKFILYCEKHLPPFEKVFTVDFKMPNNNKTDIIFELNTLKEHYGPGFPEILIYDEIIVSPDEFKIAGKLQNTLIIDKKDLSYIAFRFKQDLPNKQSILKIVGKPDINEWNGIKKPQIIIEELEWLELEL